MAESWSKSELERLADRFESVGREELEELFPAHSYRSIQAQALRLGVLRLPTETGLCARVEAGESLRQIGRALRLDTSTIREHCRRYGIPVSSQREATSRANRNVAPPALFRSPLDPAQSWVLGVVASDGNISRGGRLRVVSADADIVHQCKALTARGSVYRNGRGLHTWSYTAAELIERLDALGVPPAKSFTLRFPDARAVDLPAFARGLWDGDGYWRVDKRGALACGFGCSSLAFIEAFWAHLQQVVRSRARVYKHSAKEHWVVRLDKKRAERLGRWLYPTADVPCCARKRAVVLPFLGPNCGSSTGCG